MGAGAGHIPSGEVPNYGRCGTGACNGVLEGRRYLLRRPLLCRLALWLFRLFLRCRGLHRTDDYVSIAALEPGLAFYGADLRQILCEAQQQLLPEIHVGDLAAAQLDHGFHAVAFLQEPHGVILLELVVMVVCVGPELQLLHLDHVLLSLGFVLLLFVLVLPLAIIHGLGNGRLGSGRDQDQIETHRTRLLYRLQRRHDLDGFIGEYGADFTRTDSLIDVLTDSGSGAARRVASGNHRAAVRARGVKSIIHNYPSSEYQARTGWVL